MKTKRWRPKEDERYWYVASDGNVEDGFWNEGWGCDVWRVRINNCFRTRKEAEAARKRLLKNGI